ncbi:hypothetical protein CTAYLR_010079 [Chrysophaeum taylorii]|uniref:Large ribosomal subunit protein mL46 n=1 Tax=Chrysophaeum taylorii TaxID=2483200 RepID=A0AAD7UAR4_9STRA|nr:hypothetical protein CTAYLR_010079 [Chrysophaeum taylorii]
MATRLVGRWCRRRLSSEAEKKKRRVSSYPEKKPSRARRRRVLSDLALRRDTLEATASKSGRTIGLKASVVIERTPVLMPDPEPWEEAMWRLQEELAEHDGWDYPEEIAEPMRFKGPEDLPFELASRTTQADIDDDRRSIERSLVKSLFLVVKTPDGWRFPEAVVEESDNLHQAASRAISRTCGDNLYTYIMGNAPIGVWFQNPAAGKGDLYRQFFMKAIIVDPYNTGTVRLVDTKVTSDFAWIHKGEFPDYIADQDHALFLDHLLG